MHISITNQKGGVGKTTIACHLAFAASEAGKKVLLVDLDTQGNASAILTRDTAISHKDGGATKIFEVNAINDAITKTEIGIDVLHGGKYLDSLDTKYTAKQALEIRSEIKKLPYDYVIYDTPPAIGLRQLAPLLWADRVIIPVEPSALSMSGLASVLDWIAKARNANPSLTEKILVNRYVRTSGQQIDAVAKLKGHFGSKVISAELGNRVAVSDALAHGVPAWHYENTDKDVADAWRGLLNTIEQ